MRNSLAGLVLAAGMLPVAVAAQGREFEADYDDSHKAWKEIEAQIPPYPKAENLIAFEGGAGGHQFFVDAPSISVGDDGVVRYTLLVKTAGGAVNVSFEGMRCATREQKYYALGRSGGGWSKARNPQWRRIEVKEINRHHGLLYADYFCSGKVPVKNARSAIDALKYGPTGPSFTIRD